MPIHHYLILFDNRSDELIDFRAFGEDVRGATLAYEELEEEYRERDDPDSLALLQEGRASPLLAGSRCRGPRSLVQSAKPIRRCSAPGWLTLPRSWWERSAGRIWTTGGSTSRCRLITQCSCL